MFKTLCHATPTFNEFQHMVPLPVPGELAAVLIRAKDRHGHFERFHEPSLTKDGRDTYFMDLVVTGEACDQLRVPCALTRYGKDGSWELKVPMNDVVRAGQACAIAMTDEITCMAIPA